MDFGLGSLIAPAIGAIGGLFGGKQSADAQRDAAESSNQAMLEANRQAGTRKWSDQQQPYVFSGSAWNPYIPAPSPEALSYGQALAAGYNPAMGQRGPFGFNQMLGMLGNPGMDSPMAGLLGYGAGAPPALYPGLLTGQGQPPGVASQDPAAALAGLLPGWQGYQDLAGYVNPAGGPGIPNDPTMEDYIRTVTGTSHPFTTPGMTPLANNFYDRRRMERL